MRNTIRLYSSLTTTTAAIRTKALLNHTQPPPSSYLRLLSTTTTIKMSSSATVLGIGIPATAPGVPAEARVKLQAALDIMESDMTASPYDWEMFYFTPDMSFDLLTEKLKGRKWDVVMVGMGLRTGQPHIVQFFQKIVNTVHKELPETKFAFNTSIEKTQESCKLALES